MSEDANQAEIQPEVSAAIPESQPAQGGDTPAATPSPESGSAQQAQGAQQQPQMIPKWRFDELNHRMQAAEARAREMQQPSPQQPAVPQAPKQEEFSTYEEYIRADARFVAQQEARQTLAAERQEEQRVQRQQSEQARAYAAESNWSQKAIEAAQKHPDFFDKLAAAPQLNPILQAALKPSQAAGDLAYHLAGQPELIAKINSMHPLDGVAELGRIEGKLQGSSGQPPQRKPSAGIPALDAVGAGTKPGPRRGDQLTQDDVIARLYPNS